ncbi:hypothetical protein [Streptococcus equi]|nr:hypothetical protein [Streptococcus equi]
MRSYHKLSTRRAALEKSSSQKQAPVLLLMLAPDLLISLCDVLAV